jgi:hypothetical protein
VAIRASLRLFSEFLSDARYGWLVACEKEFGTHPVPICIGGCAGSPAATAAA